MPGLGRVHKYHEADPKHHPFKDDSRDACAYRGCYGRIKNSTAIVLTRLRHVVTMYLGRPPCLNVMAFVSYMYEDRIQRTHVRRQSTKTPPMYAILDQNNFYEGLKAHW